MDFNFKRKRRDAEVISNDVNFERDFDFDPGEVLGGDTYCRVINNLDTACMEHNILELWKFNEQKINNLNEEKILKAINRTIIR